MIGTPEAVTQDHGPWHSALVIVSDVAVTIDSAVLRQKRLLPSKGQAPSRPATGTQR